MGWARTMREHRSHGFSLFEVVLTFGLGSLLLALIVSLLRPMAQRGLQIHAQADLASQARVVARTIEASLHSTTISGIALAPEWTAGTSGWVAVQPLNGWGLDARPRWQPQVTFFVWNSQGRILLRRTWPPGGGVPPETLPATLQPLLLSSRVVAPNGSERVTASGVQAFHVQAHSSKRGMFRLELRMEHTLPDSRLERLELKKNLEVYTQL